jgi:hypothetical protein
MPEDVRALKIPVGWEPAARRGARNSVFYTAEKIISDNTNTRMFAGDLWAGGELLVWKPESSGEQKDFTFAVDSPGEKRIYITAALTPRSGKFSVLLDGEPLLTSQDSDTVDLYRPFRTLLRNIRLKSLEMTEGEHTLTLVYRGSIENVDHPEIGIDFIWIQDILK